MTVYGVNNNGLVGQFSQFKQDMKSITLSVTNNDTNTSSTISLTGDAIKAQSQSINLSGLVSFTDLKSGTTTEINGNYITTGTIKAERIDVDSLMISTIYSQSKHVKIVRDFGNYALFGYNVTPNDVNGTMIRAGTNDISIGNQGGYGYGYILVNSSGVKIGTSATVLIQTDGNNQLGFRGKSIAKPNSPSYATADNVVSVVNDIVAKINSYGLW
jgi:hypothetical protein